MNHTITILDEPSSDELAIIGEHLTAFNTEDVGPAEKQALIVAVRDESEQLRAGISGYTAWGWLYIQWLWVDDSLRGQNMASRMMQAAEDEAAKRGCHGAYIDTFNPTALKVYQRQGYKPFGELPDFPRGRTRTFLAKSLHPHRVTGAD
ncbi:GNAT family N-acetyltransferase [Aminobacter carboxidus]|uniref:GNAT family N-acetyltransferase n=1 Tax=Aminobacter carboxidus TaxID=376165 RepID=A0ABR9GH65_9HYPH|nr:GNAT family N-acetyltransferase [Aminobacter carboxidus]MBE1202989.1 GNAT family N-acetyltransferase [Aminobacter carboxidus]